MSFDLLAIGTVTRDIETADPTSVNYVLGGTVSFAAVTAARLGYNPAILTRAGEDVDLTVLHEIASVHVLPAERTTTFANLYSPEGRVQYCYTPSPPIAASDIPPQLRAPHIALLGPLANEVLPEVAAVFHSRYDCRGRAPGLDARLGRPRQSVSDRVDHDDGYPAPS